MTINWHVSKADHQTIKQIAWRAIDLFHSQNIKITPAEVMMDLTATHANGNPLKLTELLAAESFDFAHDIGGIYRHLNRETGKLEDCFLPQYSA